MIYPIPVDNVRFRLFFLITFIFTFDTQLISSPSVICSATIYIYIYASSYVSSASS